MDPSAAKEQNRQVISLTEPTVTGADSQTWKYRWIFSLAAIYNIAFGVWTCLRPQSFFEWLTMVPPNYPSLWSCLGMVVGLYGLLYAYAAVRLERAFPIILVGLIGKILGPIGWVLAVKSGEWPLRTFPLVLFNDVIWWVPFALFVFKNQRLLQAPEISR